MTHYDTVRKFKIIEEDVKHSRPALMGGEDLSLPILHALCDESLGMSKSEPIPSQSADGWRHSMNALYLRQL